MENSISVPDLMGRGLFDQGVFVLIARSIGVHLRRLLSQT